MCFHANMEFDAVTNSEPHAGPPLHRTIHLIDVENLMGGTDFDAECVSSMRAAYEAASSLYLGDQVILASSHRTAAAAWFGWPESRRLVQSGPDGADLALLKVVADETLEDRFDRVVIGSGDGIFAPACDRLQASGCQVTVIARSTTSLSQSLLRTAGDIQVLKRAETMELPKVLVAV